VYESRFESNPERTDSPTHMIYLLILSRFIWPLHLPLSIKIVVAALVLVALQFHHWSKLSSGSVF